MKCSCPWALQCCCMVLMVGGGGRQSDELAQAGRQYSYPCVQIHGVLLWDFLPNAVMSSFPSSALIVLWHPLVGGSKRRGRTLLPHLTWPQCPPEDSWGDCVRFTHLCHSLRCLRFTGVEIQRKQLPDEHLLWGGLRVNKAQRHLLDSSAPTGFSSCPGGVMSIASFRSSITSFICFDSSTVSLILMNQPRLGNPDLSFPHEENLQEFKGHFFASLSVFFLQDQLLQFPSSKKLTLHILC